MPVCGRFLKRLIFNSVDEMTENEQLAVYHKPVLYREIIDYIKEVYTEGDIIVDSTCGEGGHSALFLSEFQGKVVSFERDAEILSRAKSRLSEFEDRVDFINNNFSVTEELSPYKGKIAAILYDFGISSYHFDASGRGFSIKDKNLDMRLDPSCKRSACDIVNYAAESELADIFFYYGEERHSRRAARYIAEARKKSRIETAEELSSIVMRALKPKGYSQIHPATRIFQALRIAVNSELDHIEKALNSSWEYLRPGGIILAMSFHSLEDRIAKNIFRKLSSDGLVEIVTKKPVIPQDDEIKSNPRSRSAKIRVCKKI